MGVDRGYIINMGSPPQRSTAQPPLATAPTQRPLSEPARVDRFYYLGTVVITELRRGNIYPNTSNDRYETRPASIWTLRSASIYSIIQKAR